MFSKQISNPSGALTSVTFVFLLFAVGIILDCGFSRSAFGTLVISSTVIFYFFAAVLEVTSFLILSGQRNHFVDIAISRLVELTVAIEISVGLLEFIFLSVELFSRNLSGVLHESFLLTFLFLLLVVPLLISGEKVPFDVIEAESELIDGVTTDIPGSLFSVIFAIELVLFLLSLKWLSVSSSFILIVIGVTIPILVSFVGRIFLTRFLHADVIELVFSIGLTISLVTFIII